MAMVKCKCPHKGYGNWYIGRKCQDCKEEVRAYRRDTKGNLYVLPKRGCRKCGERYPFGKAY